MKLIGVFLKNKILNQVIHKIVQTNIGERMLRGVFWSFIGTIIAKLMVLIAGIICARILGKVEYGEFGMIRSTISMFVVLGTIGLGLTATKYISEYRNKDKDKIGSILLLTNMFAVVTGVIVSIIVLLLAPYLAETSLNAPYLVNEIRLGAVLLFFTIINSVQLGILAGFEDFKSIAINTLLSSIFEVTLMIAGAYFYSVAGAILGYGLGFIVLIALNFFSIKKNLRLNNIRLQIQMISLKNADVLYKFSLPATLSSLMVAPVFWYVRSLLVQRGGFSEMGLYEVADQWKIIILFIPGAISQVVLPILSSIVGEGNSKSFWKVLQYNIYLNSIVVTILVVIVSVSSNIILKFYGVDFVNIWPIIILACSTIFTSIAYVVGLAISSQAKMWIGFLFNAFWAIMLIVFSNLFLDIGLGATGLALAVLCSYAIHALLQYVYLYWRMKPKSSLIV